MSKIIILPQHVVSKIASGEVIERPSNIVKELIENSIDASSTKIKIIIQKAGLKKINVIDDGIGMNKDDLEKCFLPHSTSKIKTENDLLTLKSMGFRGEAISSIAAVSDVTIKSRIKANDYGYSLKLSKGKKQQIKYYGMPTGTNILVENLFSNIPVRKKFLKSEKTELNHIVSVVSNIALAFPNISFELIADEKTIFKLPASNKKTHRINKVLGSTLLDTFVPINYNHPHIKIEGYVSKPQYSTKSKKRQFVFVNKRLISSGMFSSHIKGIYGNLLQPNTHPPFLLNLNFSSDLIDVNIHPRKEEVRFINKALVYQSIKDAVEQCLQKHDLTYIKQGYKNTNQYLVSDKPKGTKLLDFYETDEYIADSHDFKKAHTTQTYDEQTQPQIIQIQNLYLITKSEKGFMIIDQHAAFFKPIRKIFGI